MKPRILYWDIETFPNIVMSWSLWVNGGLDPDNIVQERSIICAAWKWQGEKQVHHVSISPAHPIDDRKVVETLHKVISSADAIVHHNGDKFDIRWLRTRIAYHGLSPLPPLIQIDTKKIAKAAFYFNSNKLSYLAQFLGIGAKIKTEFGLWKQCLLGDKVALAKMVRYNKRDVRLLEKVYDVLVPHIPSRLNKRLFHNGEVCQYCGSGNIQHRGYYYTRTKKYQRYQCNDCHTWGRTMSPLKENK